MFDAPNAGSEGRREWVDRNGESYREKEKRGRVIKRVTAGGDSFFLCSPSAMGALVKSALGERARTGAGAWGHALELELGNKARAGWRMCLT